MSIRMQKNQKLHVIYIPGLGDTKIGGQSKAVATWKLWGVTSEVCQMKWADKEPWSPKLERLLRMIDVRVAEGKPVALVGASAGASAVINAYAARPQAIVGCVIIAGKVNRPEAIGKRYRLRDPAFITSASDCQAALEQLDTSRRKRILSLFALADELVYKPDSRITGAVNRMVPTVGHAVTIGCQITLGAPLFIRFLKSLPR